MNKKEFALSYLKLGFSIFPTKGKKPLVEWEKYQHEKPTEDQVIQWWDKWPDADIGTVTGAISGIIVVDIDGGEVPQLPPTAVSQTSPGHFQYFFKHPRFPIRNSAKIVGSNIDIRGDGGFVVLPPSKHFNKETGVQDFTYKWLISPEDGGFADLPTWLLEKLKSKKSTEEAASGSEEGSRNTDSTILIGSLLSKYRVEDWETICWPLVKAWNLYLVKPPLEERELRATFDSIKQRELDKQTSQETIFKIPSVLEFLNEEFGDIQWLIKDLIPLAGTAIIVAKRESYKTWLALYIAHCITQGLALWNKIETAKTKVLYISNDDPPPSFQSRLRTFSFTGDFFVYHRNLPDFSIDQQNGSFASVKAKIKEQGIGLLIIDILRNTHNRDSNTDRETKLVLDKYKELREANPKLVIVFIIHPSKELPPDKRIMRRQSEEAVGSYLWEAGVDTVISLTKSTEEDGTDTVVVNVTKNKQSEKTKPKPFIGIRRRPDQSVEFIFEEHIPDKLKIEAAKEYILGILSQRRCTRKELIDLTVTAGICGKRLVEEALRELNNEKRVVHTETRPHIYSFPQDEPGDETAGRNSIYDLRNAESSDTPLTQQELSYTEEADEK